MRGATVVIVVAAGLDKGERRVGRERVSVGGRRWRRREIESAASEAERRSGWVEGVGGGVAAES